MKQSVPAESYLLLLLACLATTLCCSPPDEEETAKPNVLFAIADDWGWPHAGAYGDPVVKTPVFDRLASEGVLFSHAYVSSPSCTPSRGAILTGQWHWRLEGAGNLWSVFPDKFVTYPELLEQQGYVSGHRGKAWGPGRPETSGRDLAGKQYPGFEQFLEQRARGKPFCFWLGTSDPHRPYELGSGEASGIDLAEIQLPACFPDAPEVRKDVADYYFEVQRFDSLVGDALLALEAIGELDNTIVVVTGDHGMPFPRSKSNLYDTGTRVPLAVRWPAGIKRPHRVDDLVSLSDLAPTFLEIAGLDVPDDVTGRSLLKLLTSQRSGWIDPSRSFVLTGKERHVPAQASPDMGGYPSRAIRTQDFLYIRNFRPERWPAGTPDYKNAAIPGAWLADCDNGPTKTYMVENRERDPVHRRLYDASFAKRPAEELYDLRKDPGQLSNLASDAEYAALREKLSRRLSTELEASKDPRVIGGGKDFDAYEYLGGAPKFPGL